MNILYTEYFDEYLENANNEMNKYFEANYKENYILRDTLQIPYVAKQLSKKSVQDSIIEFTGKFIDAHGKELSTAGPIYMFLFTDDHKNFFYKLFNITESEILEISKNMFSDTYNTPANFFIVKEAPHKVLLTSILIDALQNNYEDIVECCRYLFGFVEYPLMFRKFWSQGVREDVMDYTMEHLPNNFKFIRYKMKNILDLLKYDMSLSIQTFRKALILSQDHTYIDFIYRIRNQIKNTFKNIASKYYDNIQDNNTQHQNDSILDDGNLADMDGHTTNIAMLVDSTYNKFISGDINIRMAEIAANGNEIDKSILTGYINLILKTKENKMYKFIENIITAYFIKNPTDNTLDNFLNFGLSLYRSLRSTKDELYKEMREILDMWVFNIINIKQYYQREATIIAYTRGIYNYIVLMINYYN